jgi:CRP-like cAMP-binding protein
MLAYIALIVNEVHASRHETVFSEGDAAEAMFIVVRGAVRIDKNGQEVFTATDSQSFGAWALVDDEPRLMTATALEDTHMLQIHRDDFFELLSDHDEITPVIFKAVVERVKQNVIRAIDDPELGEIQKDILRVFA